MNIITLDFDPTALQELPETEPVAVEDLGNSQLGGCTSTCGWTCWWTGCAN